MINDLWYKNAVVYAVCVRTFMDANGDGVGDFAGLLRRLDYLQGLGVTTIWLTPFQPSPDRDDGYDISDYYGVDPRYGTLGDFVEFARGCVARGIRIIIDLVVNHTSDQHPWFQSARSDPGSAYRDWYVWSDREPSSAHEGMAFPGVQKSTWTYDKVARAWYFHRFYDFQPDLNTNNPRVRAEILKIMGFWLQLGVSGFRLDAAPFVIAKKGPDEPQIPRENYELLHELRELMQWRCGDAIILAEANVLPEEDMKYFGESGERVQMLFNFEVNQALFYALAGADCEPLRNALSSTRPRPATAQWATFLRNHDELDLGRLTESQRERVFAAFGPKKSMQLYDRGIRRRLAPMLGNHRKRLELAYSLMFTLPGTPVLEYGDELGMGDNLSLPERNAVRTPMQWSSEPHGGFTTSRKPALPPIDKGPYAFGKLNVAQQRRDPNSLMNWMERVIRMRKQMPAIGWGDFTVLETGTGDVLVLRYDWRNTAVIVAHNFSASSRHATFHAGDAPDDDLLVNVLSDDHSHGKGGEHTVRLEPYGYRWYRVGGLDDITRRSDIDETPERNTM